MLSFPRSTFFTVSLLAVAAALTPAWAASASLPFAWGNNGNGALGNGSTAQSNLPVTVTTSGVLSGKNITAVASGSFHSLALATDGTVYAWGDNTSGQLGNNSTTSVSVPVAVNTAGVLAGKTITAIAAGGFFSLALDSNGKVYAWGNNGFGALGNNSATSSISSVPVAVDTTGVLAAKTVTHIAAGNDFCLARTSDGKVYSWGANGNDQLGTTGNFALVPVAVNMTGALAGLTVLDIAAGATHSLVIASDGKLYSWGFNNLGQLGNGTSGATAPAPVAVNLNGAAAGKSFNGGAISAGHAHCIALAATGELYAWGDGSQSQLGHGSTASSNVPVAVNLTGALAGQTINRIAAAYAHSLVSSTSGRAFVWGSNSNGQLGTGGNTSAVPVAVDTSGALSNITISAIGGGHSATRSIVAGFVPAPTVTSITPNQTVLAGTTVTFTAAATNASSYQWSKNGTDITGATTLTYTIASAAPADAATYTLNAVNTAGSHSLSTTLVVTLPPAPGITNQPQSQIVTVGNGATFTVVASGTSLTYQWKKSGTDIPGATAATYTIASAALTDAANYTVTVSNLGGSVTSSVATLTVNLVAPTITTPPASLAVTAGNSATFTVIATGASLTYQWKKSGIDLPGATAATYTIASAALADSGSYTVAVTNSGGTATSIAATLTVNPVVVTPPPSPSRAAQTISFGEISPHRFGDAPFTVSASASSGLPLTLSVGSGNATITGSTVTLTGPGPVVLFALQTGNASYLPALVSTTLNVAPGNAIVALSALTQAFDGTAKPVTVTTTPSGLATNITYNGAAVPPSAVGTYAVAASITDASYTGSATGTLTIAAAAPVFTRQPVGLTVPSGAPVTFSVAVNSTPAATFQWRLDSTALPGATDSVLNVPAATPSHAGNYTVVATNPGGSTTSLPATLVVHADQRLANLSTRAQIGPGENVAIAGFVIEGTAARPILLRAIGPALADFALPGAITRPTLSLFQGTTRLAQNTGWSTAANAAEIAATATALGAFGLRPNSADSALLVTLAPGAYTAVVSSADASAGIALVEVYDTAGTSPGLINLACRGTVGPNDQVVIAGFTLHGNTPKKLLIRAVGPTLTAFGVKDALADPQLKLYRGSTLLASNDNWRNDPELLAASTASGSFPQTGAFPLSATGDDAALLTTLASGSYTLVVNGANGTTGAVLVEVYQVP